MPNEPTPSPETTEAALRVCACLNLRRAARAATRFYDAALEPSGLRSPQFVVLATIHAGDKPSVRALARDLGVERSVVSRRLATLRERDLVKTSRSTSGNTSHVQLTARGRRTLAKAVPLWAEAQARFEDAVGASGWTEALAVMGRIPPTP